MEWRVSLPLWGRSGAIDQSLVSPRPEPRSSMRMKLGPGHAGRILGVMRLAFDRDGALVDYTWMQFSWDPRSRMISPWQVG
jgi:hypothetical protein